MYHIDWWDLKSQVALSHILMGVAPENRGDEEEQTTQYSLIALDIITECLNDKHRRFSDDAFQIYVKDKYGDDDKVWALGEMVMSIVKDIKKAFYANYGHDPRLKYKLVNIKERGTYSPRIIMDLELTFLDFVPKLDEDDITQDVDDNPSPEKLNELIKS